MGAERCFYERLQDVYPEVPVISNKGDELVLTIVGAEKIAAHFSSPSFQEIFLREICTACGLCRPETARHEKTWRIIRHGYTPESIEDPFTLTYYQPRRDHPTRKRITIAVIDDNEPGPLARAFATNGYHTCAIRINPETVNADRLFQIPLTKAICNEQPQLAVCDKGIGYFDGLRLIQDLRDAGVFTILYTGEADSNSEVRDVADVFLMKPVAFSEILSIVTSHFPD